MKFDFKVWAENSENLLNLDDFLKRTEIGIQLGDTLSSAEINTILRQNSLLASAIGAYLSDSSSDKTIDFNSPKNHILKTINDSLQIKTPKTIELYLGNWEKISNETYKYFVALDNISIYDTVFISQTFSHDLQINNDTAEDYITDYNKLISAILIPGGINFYAKEIINHTISLLVKVIHNNSEIIPGKCFLDTNIVRDIQQECPHCYTELVRVQPIEPGKFGKIENICFNCATIKTELLKPSAIDITKVCTSHDDDTKLLFIGLNNEYHVGICEICQQLIQDETAHGWQWNSSPTHHWQTCPQCQNIISYSSEHTFGTYDASNDTGHTKACQICKYSQHEPHQWSDFWDEGTTITGKIPDIKCSTCGKSHATLTHIHQFTKGKNLEDGSHCFECEICGVQKRYTRNVSSSSDKKTLKHITQTELSPINFNQHKTIYKCAICDYIGQGQLTNHAWSLLPVNNKPYHKMICQDTNISETQLNPVIYAGCTYGGSQEIYLHKENVEDKNVWIYATCPYFGTIDDKHDPDGYCTGYLDIYSGENSFQHSYWVKINGKPYSLVTIQNYYRVSGSAGWEEVPDEVPSFEDCVKAGIIHKHTFSRTVLPPLKAGCYLEKGIENHFDYDGKGNCICKDHVHNWGEWKSDSAVSDGTHSRICSICGEQQTEKHSTNVQNTTKCNVCGQIFETEDDDDDESCDHLGYGVRYEQNSSSTTHDVVCANCGEFMYWQNCYTESTNQYVDETYHGDFCICGREMNKEYHSLTREYPHKDMDQETYHIVTCDECTYYAYETHSFDEFEAADETGHYPVCGACGYTSYAILYEHEYDSDSICTKCGYKKQ